MNRAQKIHKLSNAIREFRGLGKSQDGKITEWTFPPRPSALPRVKAWLLRLRLDVPESLEKIASFKTIVEFRAWIEKLSQ